MQQRSPITSPERTFERTHPEAVIAPLPHVPAHIEEPITIRSEGSYGSSPWISIRHGIPGGKGALPYITQELLGVVRLIISPGETTVLETTASGKLPLSFR